MNNTISLASSQKMYTYNLEGLEVAVRLRHNPFDFAPETLFSLAARKNKKRGFLFVSTILGKHVPVDPYIPLLAGAALAVQFLNKIEGVDHVDTQSILQALKSKQNTQEVYETVLSRPLVELVDESTVIGFAETATGLGHAMFSLLDNAHYLHTTREQIPSIASELNFREDHSHAVNHRCYPLDHESLKTSQRIILVDDELTTGNTVLNIIRAIDVKFSKTEYVVLSLLDWRTAKDRANFHQLEQELGIKIHTLSLLEGELEVHGEAIHLPEDSQNPTLETKMTKDSDLEWPDLNYLDLQTEVPTFSVAGAAPYLKLTGRFGLSSRDNQKIFSLARKIGEELKLDRRGNKTLCLGTGEFMYFPMLIAAHMGSGVRYHSTTRSPIYSYEKPHYAVQNGFAFLSAHEENVINYVYNVPLRHYDEVYLFLEREVSHERLIPMLATFRQLGIPRLVLVICTSQPANFLKE